MLPFLQQVSMQAALGFLLILTVHRCYPAGVPRCLQGNFIRRQIRQHFQTLCFIWSFAILINLPLFSITKYQNNDNLFDPNRTNTSSDSSQATCDTEATEVWSRTYLILLLVLTYLITGLFLILIYGQAIRLILASKKYRNQSRTQNNSKTDDSCIFSRNLLPNPDKTRLSQPARSSTSSASNNPSHRRAPMNPLTLSISDRTTSSHSSQHLQVIVMLFIVILLYILLLLPYRLLNLLFIVHNQLFQDQKMNDFLFQCLLNIVRLLVFLNCALQPIIYVIISSRLRQCVIKCLQSWWMKCSCRCRCALHEKTNEHHPHEPQTIQAYNIEKYPIRHHHDQRFVVFHDNQATVKNIHVHPHASGTVVTSFSCKKLNVIPYKVTFTNNRLK